VLSDGTGGWSVGLIEALAAKLTGMLACRQSVPAILSPRVHYARGTPPEMVRISAQSEANWSVQSRNRLDVCLADDERQATALARNSLATIRTTGSEGGEDPEAGGFHTFRHTYTTLLTQNNEEVKVVQELLRHANSRITLDLYAQAGMPNKRLAQSKLVRMVLNKGEALA
jgi:hypothetical protein